jgi:hypothetical protein
VSAEEICILKNAGAHSKKGKLTEGPNKKKTTRPLCKFAHKKFKKPMARDPELHHFDETGSRAESQYGSGSGSYS